MDMTEEQEALFFKLTPLQQKFSLNILKRMSQADSYIKAGGKAKDPDQKGSRLARNGKVSSFVGMMKRKTVEKQLITAEDIAKALMKEAGMMGNPPDDSVQSARISALKTLTDYTGDFDKNKNKVEHSGYVDRSESDLYDD